jgi:hypothetical protein
VFFSRSSAGYNALNVRSRNGACGALNGTEGVVAKSSTERVRETRQRQRRAGMRLLQIWVPDTRSPEFAAEAARQSRIIGEWDRSPEGKETLDFIESIAAIWDDDTG